MRSLPATSTNQNRNSSSDLLFRSRRSQLWLAGSAPGSLINGGKSGWNSSIYPGNFGLGQLSPNGQSPLGTDDHYKGRQPSVRWLIALSPGRGTIRRRLDTALCPQACLFISLLISLAMDVFTFGSLVIRCIVIFFFISLLIYLWCFSSPFSLSLRFSLYVTIIIIFLLFP